MSSSSTDVLFPEDFYRGRTTGIRVSDDLYAAPIVPRMGTTSRSVRHRPVNRVCSPDVSAHDGRTKLADLSPCATIGTRPSATSPPVNQARSFDVSAHGRLPAQSSPQRMPAADVPVNFVKWPFGETVPRPLDTLHAVSRRRTWSPPTLPRTHNAASQQSTASPHNFRPIRSYRSNDQLDAVEPGEEAPWVSPHYQNNNFHIIRPIAHKPAAQSNLSSAYVVSPDDGYVSQESTVQMGVVNETYSEETPSPSDSGLGELELIIREKDAEVSQLRETMERNEGAIIQVYTEKDQNWQAYLRAVIADWQRRLQHHQQHAHKMEQALLAQMLKLQNERKAVQQELEASRSAQMQSEAQVAQLQGMCEKLAAQRGEAEHQKASLQSKLEESRWEQCQRSGEISLLKSQLRDCQEDSTHKASDLIGTRAMLKDATSIQENKELELSRLRAELENVWKEAQLLRSRVQNDFGDGFGTGVQASSASACASASPCVKDCPPKGSSNSSSISCSNSSCSNSSSSSSNHDDRQYERLTREMREMRLSHEAERGQWLEEKNKVILYQERLQLNYVQMLRKNKLLEAELEQLMLELEARDIKDPAM